MLNLNNLKPEGFYIGFNRTDIAWGRFELIWDRKAFVTLGRLKARLIRTCRLMGADNKRARYILSELEIQWGEGNQLLISYPSIFKRKAGVRALEIPTDK